MNTPECKHYLSIDGNDFYCEKCDKIIKSEIIVHEEFGPEQAKFEAEQTEQFSIADIRKAFQELENQGFEFIECETLIHQLKK